MSKLSPVRADSEFVRSVATKMLRTISEPERGVALALLGVLALAAFLRFFMLSEIGIVGDDTIYYLSLARGWAEPMHDDYRLVIRAIYALVLHLADRSRLSTRVSTWRVFCSCTESPGACLAAWCRWRPPCPMR